MLKDLNSARYHARPSDILETKRSSHLSLQPADGKPIHADGPTSLSSLASNNTDVSLHWGAGFWAGLSWVVLLPPAMAVRVTHVLAFPWGFGGTPLWPLITGTLQHGGWASRREGSCPVLQRVHKSQDSISTLCGLRRIPGSVHTQEEGKRAPALTVRSARAHRQGRNCGWLFFETILPDIFRQ